MIPHRTPQRTPHRTSVDETGQKWVCRVILMACATMLLGFLQWIEVI